MYHHKERMMQLARELSRQPDPRHTLQAVVEATMELVPAAETVGISLAYRHGGIKTSASHDEVSTRGDQKQEELGEGPCADAVWDEPLVVARDLSEESRWPRWAPWMVETFGVRSMMCVRLFTQEDSLGAINMYSRRTAAFTADDRDEVQAVAAHAAVALAAANELESLHHALDSRTTIAEGIGLVMERYQVQPDAAFNLLRRLSNDRNLKLVDVARELVEQHVTKVRSAGT